MGWLAVPQSGTRLYAGKQIVDQEAILSAWPVSEAEDCCS